MGRGGKKTHKSQRNTKTKGKSSCLPEKDGTTGENNNASKVDGCCHASKAVRLQALQSSIPHVKLGNCKVCGKGQPSSKDSVKATELVPKDVCVCLRCGHQACSRQCKQQHAYQHYMTTPSHCVTLNIRLWNVWCYECDNELFASSENSQLSKCLKYIRSRLPAGLESNDFVHMSKTDEDAHQVTPISRAKGLKNLGNTCFFNSVVQNLAQTKGLQHALKECMKDNITVLIQSQKEGKEDLCVDVQAGPGTTTQALKDLLIEFGRSSQKILSPNRLFGEISKRAPQYRGFQQQDSQELLRYLLDGMKTEELKRIELSLKHELGKKGLKGQELKESLQGYLKNVKTFVDDIFGGVLVSTIQCCDCKNITHTNDGFLDLSLPVSDFLKAEALKKLSKSRRDDNTNSPATAKSVTDNGEQQVAKPKKLTKHQKKMQIREERRARRAKGKSSRQITTADDLENGEPEVNSCDTTEEDKETEGSENDTSSVLFQPCKSDDQNSDVQEIAMNKQESHNVSPHQKHSPLPDKVVLENDRGFVETVNENEDILDDNDDDDDEMKPDDQERLSALTMDFVSSMVQSCNDEAIFLKEDDSEEDFEGKEVSEEENQLEVKQQKDKEAPFVPHGSCNDYQVEPKDNSAVIAKITEEVSNLQLEPINEETVITQNELLEVDVQADQGCYVSTYQGKGIDQSEENNCSSKCGLYDKDENVQRSVLDSSYDTGVLTDNTTSSKNKTVTDCTAVSNCLNNLIHPVGTLSVNNTESKEAGAVEKPMVDQLTDIFDKVKENQRRNEEFRTQNESLDVNYQSTQLRSMSKDECDSGFSSIGEIFLGATCCDEDRYSDIEDFCDLDVPEGSVLGCLKNFCSKDILDGKNKFACENCFKISQEGIGNGEKLSKHFILTEATKQFMIAKPPKILTLHLKRFEQTGRQLKKVNRAIDFPLYLDIKPFCHRKSKVEKSETEYKLYGLVEHSGSLHGGHYVAYVYCENDSKWYYISDTRVTVVSEEVVLRKQAYLLFYHQLKDHS